MLAPVEKARRMASRFELWRAIQPAKVTKYPRLYLIELYLKDEAFQAALDEEAN